MQRDEVEVTYRCSHYEQGCHKALAELREEAERTGSAEVVRWLNATIAQRAAALCSSKETNG
jgi:hypothetical protein